MLGITPREVSPSPISCGRNSMLPPMTSTRYIVRNTKTRWRDTSLSIGARAAGETGSAVEVISNLQSHLGIPTGALRYRDHVEIQEGRRVGRRALHRSPQAWRSAWPAPCRSSGWTGRRASCRCARRGQSASCAGRAAGCRVSRQWPSDRALQVLAHACPFKEHLREHEQHEDGEPSGDVEIAIVVKLDN